jgi:hypothetical protein
MDKKEFYRGKSIVKIEWYLDECHLPGLRWGRLRIFNDGTSDSCFEEGGKLYGFEHRDYASYILNEDEYIRFEAMNEENEAESGIRLAEIVVPEWQEDREQEFEYLGTY